MIKDITTLETRLRETNLPNKQSLVFFVESMGKSFSVYSKASFNKELNKEEQKILTMNLLVNLVSTFEVFLKKVVKDLIETREGAVCQKGLKKLLQQKFPLTEILNLCKNCGPVRRKGDLTALSCFFQNLEQVDSIIGGLLEIAFLDEVGKHQCSESLNKILGDYSHKEPGKVFTSLDFEISDWRKTLDEIFLLRHNFIHQMRLGIENLNAINYFMAIETTGIVIQDFIESYKIMEK